ncbi:MAG: hypothetical protein L3J03_07900 [Desulfobacterales bacterium]|nr:hypothetical protein [Desulfobacterales bacterium]
MNYAKDPKNNSIFFLKPGGGLGIELNEHYDIEVAFYPPDEKGHEVFKQFKIYILDGNGEIVQTEEVTGRMKKYRITR